jgi:hypothetical protein
MVEVSGEQQIKYIEVATNLRITEERIGLDVLWVSYLMSVL